MGSSRRESKPASEATLLTRVWCKIWRNRECFWVCDIHKLQDGWYSGVVDNELIYSHLYNYGDFIEFHETEIFNIITSEASPI